MLPALCFSDPWNNDFDEEIGRSLYADRHPHLHDSDRKPLLETDPLVDYRQRKQEALREQDEVLDNMHSSVKDLRRVGVEIGSQLDEHRKLSENLYDRADVRWLMRCCLAIYPHLFTPCSL